MSNPRTWFITGASAGFGRLMAETLLDQGHRVAATARRPETLQDLVAKHPHSAIALPLDVTNPAQAQTAVQTALDQFEHIDVLVNNAGYGQVGAVEEVTDAEVRAQYETNVFGLLNVTRAVLPSMRRRQSGLVMNLSSMAGLLAGATFGVYASTKFAVEALSEALALELRPFNVKVLIVEPGSFRTRFTNSASIRVTTNRLPAYDLEMDDTVQYIQNMDGHQPGDPQKAVDAMIATALADNPPLRLLLGPDAYQRAQRKIAALQNDFESTKDLTVSTDFPKEAP